METLFKRILFLSSCLALAVVPCWAQQQIVRNEQRGGEKQAFSVARGKLPPAAVVATSPSTTASVEERRAEYNALLRRRDALKRYLATVPADSKDYRASEDAIRALEPRILALKKDLALSAAPPVKPSVIREATDSTPPDKSSVSNGWGDTLYSSASTSINAQPPAAPPDDDDRAADAEPQNYVEWINREIDENVNALVNQGSHSNQTETPSESGNSTSLVDQSSASDLVGVAFNLAGLSTTSDDTKDVTSVSVTTSAYALYAALKGADPLDPVFYNKNNKWRRLSFTLGFDDDEKDASGNPTNDRVTIAGLKYLIKNGQDASEKENEPEAAAIRNNLYNATVQFGKLNTEVRSFIFRNQAVRDNFVANDYATFLNSQISFLRADINRRNQLLNSATPPQAANIRQAIEKIEELITAYEASLPLPANAFDPQRDISEWTEGERQYFRVGFANALQTNFRTIFGLLSEEDRGELNDLVTKQITPFATLSRSLRKSLERIRSQPQFSFSVLTKTRKLGDDEYTGSLIYERGMATRTFLTLNGSFKYKDSKLIGGDTRGGSASGQLQFQVTPEESLISKSPIFLYLSGESSWMAGIKPTYIGQAKVKIPITNGIEIPISVTFANRTDLIDESDVRGNVGFTIDSAKLWRLFKFDTSEK